jgi:hypothetical protein
MLQNTASSLNMRPQTGQRLATFNNDSHLFKEKIKYLKALVSPRTAYRFLTTEIQFYNDAVLPHQKIFYPCPLCDQETLEVLWRPGHKEGKRSQSVADGSKITFRREQEGLVLLSEKCSKCGKTKKEIEEK